MSGNCASPHQTLEDIREVLQQLEICKHEIVNPIKKHDIQKIIDELKVSRQALLVKGDFNNSWNNELTRSKASMYAVPPITSQLKSAYSSMSRQDRPMQPPYSSMSRQDRPVQPPYSSMSRQDRPVQPMQPRYSSRSNPLADVPHPEYLDSTPPQSMNDFRVYARSNGLVSRKDIRAAAIKRGIDPVDAQRSVERLNRNSDNAKVEAYSLQMKSEVTNQLFGQSFSNLRELKARVLDIIERESSVPSEIILDVVDRISNEIYESSIK